MRHLVIALPAPSAAHAGPDAALGDATSLPELDHATGSAQDGWQAGRATPALLPQASGAGAEVVAVVPSAALSWHAISLPKGVGPRSPRLRAVLQGLLEDRLLDAPDDLHLALAPAPDTGGRLWVAACDRAWLQGWCARLEAAQRPVDRIVPELPPALADAATIVVCGDADHPQALLADAEGVWQGPLAVLAARVTQAAARPADAVALISEPPVAAQAEQAFGRAAQVMTPAQRLGEAAASAWNLAQGELDTAGRRHAMSGLGRRLAQVAVAPQWRAARWGAAVLLLAQLAGLNAWAWHEQRALAAKRAAIEEVLTARFPQVKVVIDAPLQMEREVAALRRASGVASAADLEPLLGAVATALPAGSTPSRIEFNAGELRLQGLPLEPAAAQAMRDRLRATGIGAQMQGDTLVLRTAGTP